nr:MAG TPA: hypothetical protein [Crassvirales sp.]DAL80337.1 MAG TPA: hypothetical protein [Caudoviricetes sp.]DAX21768.1 MAG TPA: hypothetical protein [Caudoviricetes sp.]
MIIQVSSILIRLIYTIKKLSYCVRTVVLV